MARSIRGGLVVTLILVAPLTLKADVVAPTNATATSNFFAPIENTISGDGLIDNGGAVETQLHDNLESNGWLSGDNDAAGNPVMASDQVLEFILPGNLDMTSASGGAHMWQHNGLDGGGNANLARGLNTFEVLVSPDLAAPFVSVGTFSLNQATNPFLDAPQGEAAQFINFSGAAVSNVRRVQIDVIAAHGGPSEQYVGLAEIRFEGTVLAPDEDRLWNVDGTASWHVGTNWTPIEYPDGNDQDAIFGSIITAPATVGVDQPATVRNIEFDNANSYALAGNSVVTLTSNTGTSLIEVKQGMHQIQADLTLANDATVTTGGTNHGLEINNKLTLNGHTMTITSGSNVAINNTIDDSSGGSINSVGLLRGGGRINGGLANMAGGTVAPGDSLGSMLVDDNYSQSAGATLAIEIGATGHDSLVVGGSAMLNGTLSVELVGGFTPAAGSQFVVLNAASGVTNSGLTLGGPDGGLFNMVVGANNVVLTIGGSLVCDFDGVNGCDLNDIDSLVTEIAAGTNNGTFDVNGDGVVDTTDLDNWLAAAGAANLASGNPYLRGDANLDGSVDVSDFNLWNGGKFAVATWSGGDFNADGFADVGDFNLWNGNKFLSADVSAVPEPSGMLLALVSALALLGFGRKRR